LRHRSVGGGADRDEQHNRACTDLFTGLHLARRAILVPAPVVAEVGYLLGRAGGAKIEPAFLRSIAQEALTIVDLELADYERMAELVAVYADFPLGTTDAAVVAVAERLEIVEIATLDRRISTRFGPAMPAASTCCPDLRRCWSGELGWLAGVLSDLPTDGRCGRVGRTGVPVDRAARLSLARIELSGKCPSGLVSAAS